MRRFRAALRQRVLDHYGRKCACCGEGTEEFLAIDHIDGGGAKHRREINRLSGWHFYRWLEQNEWPEGFQILCHNCNFSKGRYGYCPHTRTR